MAGASTADMFYLGRKSAHLGSIEPYHPWGACLGVGVPDFVACRSSPY